MRCLLGVGVAGVAEGEASKVNKFSRLCEEVATVAGVGGIKVEDLSLLRAEEAAAGVVVRRLSAGKALCVDGVLLRFKGLACLALNLRIMRSDPIVSLVAC